MRTNQILEKFSKEITPGGKVLDIGCGEGKNALWLAERGFMVTAIDKDETTINVLKKKILESNKELKIELKKQDARDLEVPNGYYDIILAFNSLIFLKKSEFLKIAARIKNYLAPGGLVFMSLFTEDDPSFSSFIKNKKTVGPNTFFNEKTGEYWQFMKKGELKKVFFDFETLLYEEKIIHDARPRPHHHGMAFYVGRKKAQNS